MPSPHSPSPQPFGFRLLDARIDIEITPPKRQNSFLGMHLGPNSRTLSISIKHDKSSLMDSVELCDQVLSSLKTFLRDQGYAPDTSTDNRITIKSTSFPDGILDHVCEEIYRIIRTQSKKSFQILGEDGETTNAEVFLDGEDLLRTAVPKLILRPGDENEVRQQKCLYIGELINNAVKLRFPEAKLKLGGGIYDTKSGLIINWHQADDAAGIYRFVGMCLKFMRKNGTQKFKEQFISNVQESLAAHDAFFKEMAGGRVTPLIRKDTLETALPPKRGEIENALFTLQRSGEIPNDVSAANIIQVSDLLRRGMLKCYYDDGSTPTNMGSISNILKTSQNELPDSIKKLNTEQLGRSLQTALNSLQPGTRQQLP